MSGFPNRPGLASYGPDVVNTRPVRDPSRELSADTFNLMRFQTAGMGLVSARAFFSFTADNPAVQLDRAEAWNPDGNTASPFDDPNITRQNTGEYDVEYTTPVTDRNGDSVALSFAWGFGVVITPSLTVIKTVMVTPLSGTANGVKVAIFNAAGSAEDGNDVAIWIG